MDEIKAISDPEPAPAPELAWAGRILGYVIIGCMIALVLFLTVWAIREIIAHW